MIHPERTRSVSEGSLRLCAYDDRKDRWMTGERRDNMDTIFGTTLVAIILLAIVALIILGMIRNKKAGKSMICGCDCKNCSGCCGSCRGCQGCAPGRERQA